MTVKDPLKIMEIRSIVLLNLKALKPEISNVIKKVERGSMMKRRVLMCTIFVAIMVLVFTGGLIAGLGNSNTRFVIDGVDVVCDPAPIVSEGVTYIPLDFVMQTFSVPIKYDQEKNVIYIGEIPGGSDLITEFKPFESGLPLSTKPTVIAGVPYNHGFWMYASWNLNGKFEKVVFKAGSDDSGYGNWVGAKADDVEILDSESIYSGDGIKEFVLDVKGVNILELMADEAIINPVAY